MKKVAAVLSLILAGVMLAGCGSAGGGTGAGGLTKVRVELFERNDAPEGKGTTTDNMMTKWINEETAKIGLEIEFVTCPRDQENQKLNAWMASSNAPDIVFTYNNENTFQRYADQNGIYALDDYLKSNGQAILDKMGGVMEYGQYEGKQFAIPGIRTLQPSPNLKIRKDWLDKLNLEMPTSIDGLYQVLKAFKENDPGGVGKENVVPFAMAAPGVEGNYGSFGDLKFSFGIENYGDFGGTFQNGVFKSAIDSPEAKEFYHFLNKLYQEGLIHQEFAVDSNGSRYTQHVTTGVAGLVDLNGAYMDNITEKAVPDVNWEVLEPIPDANGQRMMSGYEQARWLNMIPKSSKVPDKAVEYLNWMVESKADITLTNGFEGQHYKVEDGVIISTADADAKKDYWKGADLDLIGYVNYIVPRDKLDLVMPPKEAAKTARAMEFTEKYAMIPPVITQKMPVAQEKTSSLRKYINDGAAKLIVAGNFEAEYQNFISGWYSLGGAEYDKEYEDALKAKGVE